MKKNKIICEDFIDGIRDYPDNSFDLIICDPPYNLNKDFGIYKEKDMKEEWLPWSKKWIDECIRVLDKNGNIFIYGIHKYLCFLQCYLMESELEYRRQIIWKYENGFAGYGKRNLAAHYEPILWFSKGKDYTYNTIREPYKSTERLKNKITKNGKVWRPHPDGRMAGDIWNFPTLSGKRFASEKVDHPTQKPMSISRRIVSHFSKKGDYILVPFVGSGSECVACVELERSFTGFEINPEYVKIANNRIKDLKN